MELGTALALAQFADQCIKFVSLTPLNRMSCAPV